MAIQEFLDGGFIGKLGNVVGQHVGNRRYVRTYVIPRDPKTPNQMANRRMFAHAQELAQQAMNINGKADYWAGLPGGEYPHRVGTAMRRLKAGLGDTEALPLYPDGMAPPNLIMGLSADWTTGSNEVIITSQSPAMTEARLFTVIVRDFDRTQNDWHTQSYQITINAQSTFGLTEPWLSEQSYPDGAWIEAATSDDSTHGDVRIELIRQPLIQPTVPYLYSWLGWAGPSWSKAQERLELRLNYSAPPITSRVNFRVRTYNSLTQEWRDETYLIVFEGGYAPNPILTWNKEYSYPTGAEIYHEEYNDTEARVMWEVDALTLRQPSTP